MKSCDLVFPGVSSSAPTTPGGSPGNSRKRSRSRNVLNRVTQTFTRSSGDKDKVAGGKKSVTSGGMDGLEFRKRGREMVDYIVDYLDNIDARRVTPNIEPGYLQVRLKRFHENDCSVTFSF